MKTKKKITIECKDITQKQFSNLIIELNLICKQWRPYAQLELKHLILKRL
jgi:hypothetical protein